MADPDWVVNATAAFDRNWIDEVVRAHRGAAIVSLRPVDQQTFKTICGLDASVSFPTALLHAERLLVIWKVTERLAA